MTGLCQKPTRLHLWKRLNINGPPRETAIRSGTVGPQAEGYLTSQDITQHSRQIPLLSRQCVEIERGTPSSIHRLHERKDFETAFRASHRSRYRVDPLNPPK